MMNEFTDYLLKRGYSNQSAETYLHCVSAFTQWANDQLIDPNFATYTDMLAYLQYLKKRSITLRTLRNYFTAIAHYFEYLIEKNMATNNPLRYLKIQAHQSPTLHTILSRQQLETLHTDFDVGGERLTKPSALASAHRKKVTIGLMVYQGLDTHALSVLTAKHINLEQGTVSVPLTRKHAPRTLALQSAQIMEFYRYLSEVRDELLAYFPQRTDQLLVHGYAHFRDAQKRLIGRLKKHVPDLTSVQQIRASVINHWLKTYNLREVQYMAGHRHVSSTEIYLRNDIETLQLDIERLHPAEDFSF